MREIYGYVVEKYYENVKKVRSTYLGETIVFLIIRESEVTYYFDIENGRYYLSFVWRDKKGNWRMNRKGEEKLRQKVFKLKEEREDLEMRAAEMIVKESREVIKRVKDAGKKDEEKLKVGLQRYFGLIREKEFLVYMNEIVKEG